MRLMIVWCACAALAAASANAQTPDSSGVINVTPADLARIMTLGENNPIKSIDAGKHTVFVWYETRRPGRSDDGVLHSEMTEIYLMLEGSAVMRTGGKLTSPKKLVVPGMLPGTDVPRFLTPSLSGKSEGGMSRKVSVGDIIVIPPNTVHVWESVDAPRISYVIFRIDPEHTLHGGYTNPALTK